jgi:quercetin dioxygenase-like cupin family protein
MKSILRSYVVVAVSCLFPAAGLAQVEQKKVVSEPATHSVVLASAVAFQPLEIPGFASGVKLAVIHGDPNADSGDYTVRLVFPDGYRFPAHWHPMAEHLTVLEGALLLGMGDKPDEAKMQTLTAGTFMYIPGKMSHFGGAKGATVIQLHGMAPFKIELTNPAAQ